MSVADLDVWARPDATALVWCPPVLGVTPTTVEVRYRYATVPVAVKGGHRRTETSTRAISPWFAGPLAVAIVIATTLVVSGVNRPGTLTDSAPAPQRAPDKPDIIPGVAGQLGLGSSTGARPAGHNGARRAVDCSRPGGLLNLGNWKLTLPTGENGGPTEIRGQQLGSFVDNDWFNVGHGCEAVAFRAPVNGVTTSGSTNPRSELREMTDGGAANAGWSSTSGTHTMTLTEAFTHLPDGKPQLVGGQIHDATHDITVFRLEGSNLYVTNDDDPRYQLVTSDYILGRPFEAKYVVSRGQVRAYYNGNLVATIDSEFSGAYFKAGAYTQANCGNVSRCDSGNYGEVLIYALKVTHNPAPGRSSRGTPASPPGRGTPRRGGD